MFRQRLSLAMTVAFSVFALLSATGAAAVFCYGVQNTVVVRVLAQVLAFRKGVALANWVLTSCEGDQGCIAVPGSDTIRIRAH